jgi:hypothetical protein
LNNGAQFSYHFYGACEPYLRPSKSSGRWG